MMWFFAHGIILYSNVLFLLALVYCFFLFFFSSRRRHTRSLCDWSSDVCSSDLRSAGRPSGSADSDARTCVIVARNPHPVRRMQGCPTLQVCCTDTRHPAARRG